jgi:hypothetical protein
MRLLQRHEGMNTEHIQKRYSIDLEQSYDIAIVPQTRLALLPGDLVLWCGGLGHRGMIRFNC